MTDMQIFDDRACELGEGPLWHPERQQLFWFDIMGKRLLSRQGDTPLEWQFDEHVSAAGWIDHDRLLIASETALFEFDLNTEEQTYVTALEVDSPNTRSNDGRADPWGGFWIGTMAKNAEAGRGAIYRYFDGSLRKLFSRISVPNTICFDPDRCCAYYSDTLTGKVMRQPLDPETGWPEGKPGVFLDLREDGLNPDGAVVDAAGNVWIAEWGAARVSTYTPDGTLLGSMSADALHTSCPAFGGPGLTDLYCTSAQLMLLPEVLDRQPSNGMLFMSPGAGVGRAEPRVIL